MPDRIQLSRRKGWRMPANTAKVDRTTKWGNPFRVGDQVQARPELPTAACFSQKEAVEAFRTLLNAPNASAFRNAIREQLRGKNLACWCPLDGPCHADVLMEIANG